MLVIRGTALVCALAALPVLGPVAFIQVASAQQLEMVGTVGKPPLEMVGTVGKPPLAATIAPTWPTVLTPASTADPSEQPPQQWSAKDIEEGRTRCAVLLQGLDVVTHPADPIREGDACGTPAPMQLVSIGSSPRIVFSPPATLNCEMIVALHTWLQRDVQPLARQHLGAPVTGVKTMSSFSCRNAYGRARSKLSEHGRVNAIDIGGLVTTQGEAQVVADWGPIARGGPTGVAKAKAETVKRQAETAAAARKEKGHAKPEDGPRVAAPGGDTGRSYQAGTSIPMPRITFGFRTPGDESSDPSTGLGWAPPSRLGGPKEADAATLPGKTVFLHAIHKAACTVFSTVLGPEANEAHGNHFHLDLAVRNSANICQ